MPAEWEEHECCWMQWPTETFPANATPSWSHFDVEKARIAWANVANAINRFEQLKMIVHPNDYQSALKLLDQSVEILKTPIDDAWCRDTGAIFLLNDNTVESIFGIGLKQFLPTLKLLLISKKQLTSEFKEFNFLSVKRSANSF